MKDVFISHSSEDIKQVKAIQKDIELSGLTCWASYNIKDLHSGEDYMSEIVDAIQECRVFYVALVRMHISHMMCLKSYILQTKE